ncbi:MAG: hypothetical protein HY275_09340 [Gemmatimonadetes bacterium]|nr:hypothetical protein [Gemmatimonadota bacterium]
MSRPFPDALRARPGTISVGDGLGERVTIRVQLLEAWDAVLIEASPNEPVVAVKVAALAALDPSADFHDDFVVKHLGVEVRDESQGLAQAGIPPHATLSLSHRRRRPVT